MIEEESASTINNHIEAPSKVIPIKEEYKENAYPRSSSENWTHAFQEQVRQMQEKKQNELQNALFRITVRDPEEPQFENENIREVEIDEEAIARLTQQEHFKELKSNKKARKE